MVNEKDVEHIAGLADIAIGREELAGFTSQLNEILEYFDLLDQVQGQACPMEEQYNIFRKDEPEPSLPQELVLKNAAEQEDGFFKAPRVM